MTGTPLVARAAALAVAAGAADLRAHAGAPPVVVLVELGFLTSPAEDRLLARAAYRARAAGGLCRGVLRTLRRQPSACGSR